jgi:hypothetical protein
MNTKRAFGWALLALSVSFLAACSSINARGHIKGQAGIQGYDADTPITSPYEISGEVKFKVQTKKPILTIEVIDPGTVITTSVAGTKGRLDGSGTTDNGNTLIIRK